MRSMYEHLRKCALLDRFASWVQAIRFGVEKPGRKLYAERHGQINLPSGRCCHTYS